MAYGYSKKKNANFFKTSEDLHLIELRNSVKDCVDLVHNAIVTYEDFLIVDERERSYRWGYFGIREKTEGR